MRPRVRPAATPQSSGPALTAVLTFTAAISFSIAVAAAVEFSPLWWISAATTAVLCGSGLLLSQIPEQRGTAHLLLGGASTANLIELVFWTGPSNYFGELGYVSQWLPAPLLALAFLTYPGGTPGVGGRRLFVGASCWSVLPRLLAVLTRTRDAVNSPPGEWFGLVDAPAFSDAMSWVEALGSPVLAGWATWEFARRWREAHGTARTVTRIMAAAGTLLAWGLAAREAGRMLFLADLMPRGTWDRIGDVHQLVIVASVATVGYTLVRSFARRPRVAERLVATAGDPVGLQTALREELGDPSVTLYFRVDQAWRTAEGRPATLPSGPDRDLVELGVADGRVTVMAALDPGDRLDPVRRRVALQASGMVLNAASVAIERDAYVAEVAASRGRIAAEAEAQRRRLERMLHDGVQQSLLATTATLSRARLAGRAGDTAAMTQTIDQANVQLLEALADLRRVARGIYPAALAESGLVAGVQSLIDRWAGVRLLVEPPEESYADLAEDSASLLYFAVAEGLANAHKYGHAPVSVVLSQDSRTVSAEVTDAGPGGAAIVPGGGLEGLRDRVEGLEGGLTLSGGPEGSRLVVTLPRR